MDYNKKAPFVGIDYEEYHENEIYALTINPSDTYQKFGRTDRLQLFQREIDKMLSNIKHIEYDLRIEVSKLGRLHCHGYMRIRKNMKQKFYIDSITELKEIGCFTIKHIDNYVTWHSYIHKQELTTLRINNSLKLYDDANTLYMAHLQEKDIEYQV